jgi:hypothetical protein
MDIGNQQRVIIVELDKTTPIEPLAPVAEEADAADLEMAVEWPLPLVIEPVS